MMYRTLAILSMACILGVSSAAGQSDGSFAEEVASIRLDELEAREPLVVVAPLRKLLGFDVEILVVNRSWRQIEISVDILAGAGFVRPLTRTQAPSKRHQRISLSEHVRSEATAVRLSYFDLPDALQAFLIYTERNETGKVFVESFDLSTSHVSQVLLWPSAADSRLPVEVAITNVSEKPVVVELTYADGKEQIKLAAWESRIQLLAADQMTASVRYIAGQGSVVVHGLQWYRNMPASVASIPEVVIRATSELTTVHVPTRSDGGLTALRVAVENPSDDKADTLLSLLSTETGDVLASSSVALPPHQARTVFLEQIWGHITDWRKTRIVVGPQGNGVSAAGLADLGGGEIVELSFFRIQDVHNSGSYPLYDFGRYTTVVRVLNLGREPSIVGLELSWDQGAYSLGPLTIDPYHTEVIDITAIVSQLQQPDVLGRKAPESVPRGFLKWLVLSGSGELLARTEIQVNGFSDRFGVNCFGCCWETPFGEIIPGDIVLTDPGVGTQFETAVRYQTCSGTDGPWYFPGATLSYSSPFAWDSHTVSASAGDDDMLSFSGTAHGTTVTCSVTTRPIDRENRADACDLWRKSIHCANYECATNKKCEDQTTTCNGCLICCSKLRSYWQCKKRAANLVASEYNACQGNCANSHCS